MRVLKRSASLFLWGADLGITSNPSPVQPTVNVPALGTTQPTRPMPRTEPYVSVLLDRWAFATTRSGRSTRAWAT